VCGRVYLPSRHLWKRLKDGRRGNVVGVQVRRRKGRGCERDEDMVRVDRW
jgi:hypothetical protein